MKTQSLLYVLLFCFAAFTACDKEAGPVMNTNPGAPVITSPESGQAYTLNEEAADQELMTMQWDNPDYGFPSAPSYEIQMAPAGDNFTNPSLLANVNGTSFSITVGEMNAKLLGLDYPSGEETSLEFRVVASLSDSLDKQLSAPITLSFIPYSTCKYCPAIYVPGGYQSASGYGSDWTPADAPALNAPEDKDVYQGYVYMANGSNQFKFTPERNWALDFGDDGGDGTLEVQSANIELADPGYYKIDVDFNAMTYTTLNTQWGLIGDATGSWETDQDMSYDADAKVWTLTTDLSPGAIKFRANDAWSLNYGDNGGDGILELNGSDISVSAAGNYTVTLNLSTWPYTYSIAQN